MDNRKQGFTLIELLVVIAIIALLLAILIPSLKKVKSQAKAVVCNTNLHQWSLTFEMYTNDNNSTFMPGIDEDWATGKYSWIVATMPYHNTPEIRFCPNADRTAAEGAIGPKAAWDMTPEVNAGQLTALRDTEYKTGSYTINWWVNSSKINRSGGQYNMNNRWRTITQSDTSSIPVLADGGFILARPMAGDQPPQYDGQFAWSAGGKGMKRVCTDRHNGHINILFMDWSSHKVGLKDLWYQRWHKNYVNPATPPVWPVWMEKF